MLSSETGNFSLILFFMKGLCSNHNKTNPKHITVSRTHYEKSYKINCSKQPGKIFRQQQNLFFNLKNKWRIIINQAGLHHDGNGSKTDKVELFI